jgi:hypothetical protein
MGEGRRPYIYRHPCGTRTLRSPSVRIRRQGNLPVPRRLRQWRRERGLTPWVHKPVTKSATEIQDFVSLRADTRAPRGGRVYGAHQRQTIGAHAPYTAEERKKEKKGGRGNDGPQAKVEWAEGDENRPRSRLPVFLFTSSNLNCKFESVCVKFKPRLNVYNNMN